jgi:NAD(P)-dependent dehydrogenase (short-subunit alcohol dehydrogenase family)
VADEQNVLFKVSGAARGLGLTTASALFEAGSHVFCLDVLPEPTSGPYVIVRDRARRAGLTFEYRQVNLTEEDAIKEAFDGIGRYSHNVLNVPVQCYVSAAGIQHEVMLIDSTPAEFRRVLEVNVSGTFLSSQAAAQVMRQHGKGGSIILVASMSGQIANRVSYFFVATPLLTCSHPLTISSKGCPMWSLVRRTVSYTRPFRMTHYYQQQHFESSRSTISPVRGRRMDGTRHPRQLPIARYIASSNFVLSANHGSGLNHCRIHQDGHDGRHVGRQTSSGASLGKRQSHEASRFVHFYRDSFLCVLTTERSAGQESLMSLRGPLSF